MNINEFLKKFGSMVNEKELTDRQIWAKADAGDPSILSDSRAGVMKSDWHHAPIHRLAELGVEEVIQHPMFYTLKNIAGETPADIWLMKFGFIHGGNKKYSIPPKVKLQKLVETHLGGEYTIKGVSQTAITISDGDVTISLRGDIDLRDPQKSKVDNVVINYRQNDLLENAIDSVAELFGL